MTVLIFLCATDNNQLCVLFCCWVIYAFYTVYFLLIFLPFSIYVHSKQISYQKVHCGISSFQIVIEKVNFACWLVHNLLVPLGIIGPCPSHKISYVAVHQTKSAIFGFKSQPLYSPHMKTGEIIFLVKTQNTEKCEKQSYIFLVFVI